MRLKKRTKIKRQRREDKEPSDKRGQKAKTKRGLKSDRDI